MRINKKYIDELTYEIIGAAIEVHKLTGPGLMESAYQTCLIKEFYIRGLDFKTEQTIDFHYKGNMIKTKLRYDFLIENEIIVELKSVETIKPIFEAQLLTYMKLLSKPKGILMNFNVKNIFKEGKKTFVNELYRALP